LLASWMTRPGFDTSGFGVCFGAEKASSGPGESSQALADIDSVADTSAGSRPKRLSDFSAPRRWARPEPPVADRIVLDPSLAETPSLPVVDPPEIRDPTDAKDPRVDPPETTERSATSPRRIDRQPVGRNVDVAACWPFPQMLVESLEPLRAEPQTAEWADAILQHLHTLNDVPTLGDPEANVQLEKLTQLAKVSSRLAAQSTDLNQRARVLRVGYSLQRRLAIWIPVNQIVANVTQPVSISRSDSDGMRAALGEVHRAMRSINNVRAWQEYLLLNRISQYANQQLVVDVAGRSRIAREVLQRLDSSRLNSVQQEFFAKPEFTQFTDELRQWVSEPIDYASMLDDLERLETQPSETTALRVAEQYQLLRWSLVEPAAQLGDQLNTYYRNANVRAAVSGELVNLMMPQMGETEEEVNDHLLGSRILGRSKVSTHLNVELIPDPDEWRIGLEALGKVDSKTQTRHGPARFFNAGRSRYQAKKLIVVNCQGILTRDSKASASSDADLTRMETDFDDMPLINVLARAIARRQYDSKTDDAKWQIEGLVAKRVRRRFDAEVESQMLEVREKFVDEVQRPLQRLGLEPEAVDMNTTDERLVVRYRLAGPSQLGASTPRPQAPANSLLSVQIHESAFNNIAGSLGLRGRRCELRTLFRDVAAKFGQTNYVVPEDVPEDVVIQMDDEEPIRFIVDGDRVEIKLRIAMLSNGRRQTWNDFEVRAVYGPLVDGLHVQIVRDGYINLKGKRLSIRDQVALRGIFSKVLAQRPEIDFSQHLANDSRLKDMGVLQYVMRDGWVGLAIGYKRNRPTRMRLADERGSE
jgi:hypothetical protein